MTTLRSRLLAAGLALAMILVALPAPPAAADHDGSCPSDYEEFRRGWVALSHPATEEGVRVSSALYLQVFWQTNPTVDLDIMQFNAQTWTNGQDAYVIDLGCLADGTHEYCLERLDPLDRQNTRGFYLQPMIEDYDYRVTFFTPNRQPLDTHDPDVASEFGSDEDSCSMDGGAEVAPHGAQYAVVWLADGVPLGLQADSQLYGIYSEHFRFDIEGAGTTA